MRNSEIYKRELNNIEVPEDLILRTKNKIESQKFKKNTFGLFFKPMLAFSIILVVSLLFGRGLFSNKLDVYTNEKVIESKQYSNYFVKRVSEQVLEEDKKNLKIKYSDEIVEINDDDTYNKIVEYMDTYTGNSNNLGVVSRVKYNANDLSSFYFLREKDIILVYVGDKYIIRIPYKTSDIVIIKLNTDKFSHYFIHPDRKNNDVDSCLKELRNYLISKIDDSKKSNDDNKENNTNNEENSSVDNQESNSSDNLDNSNNNDSNNSQNEVVIIPKTYGDVDRNGEISARDVSMIKQHVSGVKKITNEDARKAADVNGDGLITGADAKLLQYAVVRAIDFDGNSQITNVILYGDINMDGEITQADYNDIKRHIDGEIKLTYTNIADINGDGNVNGCDLFLIEGVINGTYDHSNMLVPITDYVMYGDVDLNGNIQSRDATVIKQYVSGLRTLNTQQLKNADVNADGVVNETDAQLIQEYVVKMHENTLPYRPIK